MKKFILLVVLMLMVAGCGKWLPKEGISIRQYTEIEYSMGSNRPYYAIKTYLNKYGYTFSIWSSSTVAFNKKEVEKAKKEQWARAVKEREKMIQFFEN